MKSQKAKKFIDNNKMDAANLVDKDGFGWVVIGIYDAYRAVVRAEQDADDRMRQKALKVFCASNCPKGCSFGADGNIGCGAKAIFIQKLNEE